MNKNNKFFKFNEDIFLALNDKCQEYENMYDEHKNFLIVNTTDKTIEIQSLIMYKSHQNSLIKSLDNCLSIPKEIFQEKYKKIAEHISKENSLREIKGKIHIDLSIFEKYLNRL